MGTALGLLFVFLEYELKKFRRIEMKKLFVLVSRLTREDRGQDLVEYALLAGFIAVAAGALLPGISSSISIIFSRMASVLSAAAS